MFLLQGSSRGLLDLTGAGYAAFRASSFALMLGNQRQIRISISRIFFKLFRFSIASIDTYHLFSLFTFQAFVYPNRIDSPDPCVIPHVIHAGMQELLSTKTDVSGTVKQLPTLFISNVKTRKNLCLTLNTSKWRCSKTFMLDLYLELRHYQSLYVIIYIIFANKTKQNKIYNKITKKYLFPVEINIH